MVKKEEKVEACQCNGKCCCGGNACWIILSILCLIAAVLACFYACKASQAAEKVYDLNVISAWWEENFNKMNEVYQSEAYIKYASEQADQTVEYFNSLAGDSDTANTADSSADESENITAGWDDIKSVVENMLATVPVRGDANARFTIVEYTELLCPFCQRHSQEGTINAVIDQFPGEVNSLSRHFIIHGDSAVQLANAMECVAELNPSVYYDVFEEAFNQYPIELPALISLAANYGVDEAALQACSDEWKYTQAVNDMMNQWNELFGVNWTPGNVIIDRETGNYRLVSGAYPVDEFVNAINELKNA